MLFEQHQLFELQQFSDNIKSMEKMHSPHQIKYRNIGFMQNINLQQISCWIR